MQLTSSSLDKTLSFELVDGTSYKNMKFSDILSASTMMALNQEPDVKHASYILYITDGTPNDYTAYKYAKFISADGAVEYFGIPWIKESSITENAHPTTVFTCPDATAEEIATVRSFLVAAGITKVLVSTL